MKKFAFTTEKVNTVILLSGSGSNARALLEYEKTHKECAYHVTGLVTDMPGSSNTRQIAEEYDLPWAHCDIRAFYAEHGEETTRLDTPRRRELRDQWSEKLYQTVRGFPCEFLLFAGFMSLTNLAEHIPCLNVHPGDLTRCDVEGRRLYTGLHVLPVGKHETGFGSAGMEISAGHLFIGGGGPVIGPAQDHDHNFFQRVIEPFQDPQGFFQLGKAFGASVAGVDQNIFKALGGKRLHDIAHDGTETGGPHIDGSRQLSAGKTVVQGRSHNAA